MPTPFVKVIGYHTCARKLGERIAAGSEELRPGMKSQDKEYDWLGTGLYFWIGNFLLAHWWMNKLLDIDPTFQGTILKYEIEPANCLDLSDAKYLLPLRKHENAINWAARGVRPVNKRAPEGHRIAGEYTERFLDHAVIDDYCTNIEPNIETVYGVFQCGPPIYTGAGLNAYNHAQLAVREKGLHRIKFAGIDIQ